MDSAPSAPQAMPDLLQPVFGIIALGLGSACRTCQTRPDASLRLGSWDASAEAQRGKEAAAVAVSVLVWRRAWLCQRMRRLLLELSLCSVRRKKKYSSRPRSPADKSEALKAPSPSQSNRRKAPLATAAQGSRLRFIKLCYEFPLCPKSLLSLSLSLSFSFKLWRRLSLPLPAEHRGPLLGGPPLGASAPKHARLGALEVCADGEREGRGGGGCSQFPCSAAAGPFVSCCASASSRPTNRRKASAYGMENRLSTVISNSRLHRSSVTAFFAALRQVRIMGRGEREVYTGYTLITRPGECVTSMQVPSAV